VGVFLFSPSTPSKSLVPEEQFARLNVEETVIERRVGNVQRPPVEQLRPRNSASESDYVPMQPSVKQREETLARKAQSESVLTKDDYSEGNYALMMAKPKSKPSPKPVSPQPAPQPEADYALMEMTAGGQLETAVESMPVPTALDIMSIIPPLGPSELETDYALMVPGDGRTSPVLYETKKTVPEAAIELSRSPDTHRKDTPNASEKRDTKPTLKLSKEASRPLEPVKEASRSPRELSREDEGDYAMLCGGGAKSEYVLMTPIIKQPMLLSTDNLSLHLNNPSTAHSPVLAKEPLLVSEPKQLARPLKPHATTSKQPELNYASLESQDSDAESQPPLMRNLSSDSSGESDVTTVCATQYAQIDFERTQQQQRQPQAAAPKKSKVQ